MRSFLSSCYLNFPIAAFAVACGDVQGAKATQEAFSQTCPVVSQCRSLVEATCISRKAAKSTQMKQLEMLNGVANGIPVVGHLKGTVHFIGKPKINIRYYSKTSLISSSIHYVLLIYI